MGTHEQSLIQMLILQAVSCTDVKVFNYYFIISVTVWYCPTIVI